MGMLATWIFRATTPLRDLKFQLAHLRYVVMSKIFSFKRIPKGLVKDVRMLAREAGVRQTLQPKAPPKAPAKAPQKYPPRRR